MKSGPVHETSSSTSSSLLVRAQSRDPEAWERLAGLYTPLVYRWARQAKLQDSDAADLVQDVFQAAAIGIGSFRRESLDVSFRGWLWGITRHKLKDHFRRLGSRPQATGGTEAQWQMQQLPEIPPEDSSDSLKRDVVGSLSKRALELIQTDFNERTWRASWRVSVEQQSPADVAAELQMSVASVYQAKSRVLARVRRELEGLME